MGDRANKNARNWATATSLIPIFGGNISQGILQRNLSKQQQESADKINPVDEVYNESPYAKQQLATAEQMLNGRMAGASAATNNIYNNQSNAFLNLSRAAGSPQQMMAAAGALQGNTNSALDNLAVQESQYKTQMLGNFNNALGVMTNEGDKMYADKTNRFNRQYAEKQGLLNSSQQNFSNSIQSASNAMQAGVDTALKVFGIPGMGGGSSLGSTGRATSSGNSYAQPGGFNPFATAGNNGMSPYRP